MEENNTHKALSLLQKHHKDFIKAAKAIAGNAREVQNYAEDYVQEAYIKLSRYEDLYERIVKNGKATKGYMFFALRSIIINDLKKKSNLNYNHLGDNFDFDFQLQLYDEPRDSKTVAIERLEEKMVEVLDGRIHWFDLMLFKRYIETGKSYQTIATETGLGVQTIYLSLKASKLIIAEELREDYIDYLNGQYNLID